MKTKSVWVCSSCGNESPRWEGRCPACGEWNTLVEEKISARPGSPRRENRESRTQSLPVAIDDIQASNEKRIKMPSGELNRVLGGGLVQGSIILIGGEPGIGKSTLVLQNLLAIKSKSILYVSGEESSTQIKMRADRIGRGSKNCFILSETSLDAVFEHLQHSQPGIVVIDSIQTIMTDELESTAGSVGQVRECASRLQQFAKRTGVPVILIGHITKEGSLAGPKVLEHIVDAVLRFEGDRQGLYRILRPIKNRFGSTSELGIYEMQRQGLREVTNPSEMLLTHASDAERLSGITIGVTVEGNRPLLIETQALVSSAAYGTPQRSVTGFDPRRMNMLLAVLEKRAGFKLAAKDVFLNIAGGIKVNDPALDLAIITAILSSNFDIPVSLRTCFTGEVGLSGEIRPVSRIEQRISEAAKMGMGTILIPQCNLKGADPSQFGLRIVEVAKVEEALRELFG